MILAIHLIFSIASGGYSLYYYFKDSPAIVNTCINGSTDKVQIQTCKQGEEVVKGVLVSIFIFVWLMELCKFTVSVLGYLCIDRHFFKGVSLS